MRTIPFISIIACLLLTVMVQSQMLLNPDVFSFVEWAQRLLAGGSYHHDFFETNPPLIIYLSIPPLWAANYLHLPLIATIQAYLTSLILLSLIFCYYLSGKIFAQRDITLRLGFLITATLIQLILPLESYGQREQLLLAFMLPYLMSTAIQLHGDRLPLSSKLLSGFLAGIGFALKPFFLLIPALVAIYSLNHQRRLLAVITLDNLTLSSVLALYAVFVSLYHPDYLSIVIPMMLHYYYQGLSTAYHYLLYAPPIPFILWLLGYYTISAARYQYQYFYNILAVATLACFIIYLLGRVAHYYHLSPSYSIALLLFITIKLEDLIKRGLQVNKDPFLIAYFAFFVINSLIAIHIYWPHSPLSLVFACFALIYFYLILRSIDKLSHRYKPVYLALAVEMAVILFIPCVTFYKIYHNGIQRKARLLKLVDVYRSHAEHKAIYIISAECDHTQPLIHLAHASNASRFPLLWMLPGIYRELVNNGAPRDAREDLNRISGMVASDIRAKQPEIVLVDINKQWLSIVTKQMDYLKEFSKNVTFKQAWQDYQLLTTYTEPPADRHGAAFTFAVYQRKHYS